MLLVVGLSRCVVNVVLIHKQLSYTVKTTNTTKAIAVPSTEITDPRKKKFISRCAAALVVGCCTI